MNTRQLTRPMPMEVDLNALEMFQAEAVATMNRLEQSIKTLQTDVMSLQGQITIAGKVLTWMQEHRPEALQDYNTTQAVATRLSESNNGEVMTEKMV